MVTDADAMHTFPHRSDGSTRFWPTVALVSGLACTVLLTLWVDSQTKRMRTERLVGASNGVHRLLLQGLRRPLYGLGGLRGAMSAAGQRLDAEAVRRYVASRDLPQEFPGVLGFGIIERVERADLATWATAPRGEYGGGFAVKAEGTARDAYVIRAIEPVSSNRAALGFNVGSEATRRRAIEHAFATRSPAMTGPIRLLQAPDEPGALIFLPIPRADARGAALPVVETAYAPIVFPRMLDAVLAGGGQVVVELRDVDSAPESSLLYSTHRLVGTGATREIPFEFAGRHYRATYRGTPALYQGLSAGASSVAALSGLLVTLITVALLWTLARARDRAQLLARRMSHDLARVSMAARLTGNAVVITDRDRRIQWVNAAFEKLSGYSLAQARGSSPGRLVQYERTAASSIEAMRDALDRGQPFHGEVDNRSRDGREYRVALEIQPIASDTGELDGFVAVQTDITAERAARLALEASEARLRGLFETSPVGIALIERGTGRILDANFALVEQSGYSVEELRGLGRESLVAGATGDAAHAEVELAEHGRFQAYETTYRRSNGEVYPVRVQGTAVREPDGRDVIWQLVEDVSERRRVERLKGEFVSTVSHELRTPLTSIVGALGLMQSGALGEVEGPLREMVDIAADNSRRLTQLVNDLLDMEKLAAGKVEYRLEAVDVAGLLQKAAAGLREFATPRGVEIVVCAQPRGAVLADAQRLEQVLVNLLSNACKHSPPGSRVDLCAEPLPGGDVVIDVVDRGSGIPAAFRSRIFEKFAQADQGDNRVQGGTGLGLAICRELVQDMGGAIGFESEEGVGTHFWIRLPGPGGHGAEANAASGEPRPRVLVVEDDPAVAAIAALELGALAQVDKAATLREALAAVRRAHYDLLVLDLRLPDGDGTVVWETLHHAQPALRFIVLSGYEVPRALATTVDAVVAKGEHAPAQLRDVASRLLAGNRAHGGN